MAKKQTQSQDPQVYYSKDTYNKAISNLVGKQEEFNNKVSQYNKDMEAYSTAVKQYLVDSDIYQDQNQVYTDSKSAYETAAKERYGRSMESYNDELDYLDTVAEDQEAYNELKGNVPDEPLSYEDYFVGRKAIDAPDEREVEQYKEHYVSPDKSTIYDNVYGDAVRRGVPIEPAMLAVEDEGRIRAMYKEPTAPVTPEEPIYPIKDFSTDITYEDTYEGLTMKPTWATEIKDNPAAVIGTLDPLDTNYNKGFTQQQSDNFPEEIKNKYNLSYTNEMAEGGTVEKEPKSNVVYFEDDPQYIDYMGKEHEFGKKQASYATALKEYESSLPDHTAAIKEHEANMASKAAYKDWMKEALVDATQMEVTEDGYTRAKPVRTDANAAYFKMEGDGKTPLSVFNYPGSDTEKGYIDSTAPESLVAPEKPERTHDQMVYDNTYAGTVMAPAWATNIKDKKDAIIGSTDPLDTTFKKGFTYAEAQDFPQAVKDKFNLSYQPEGGYSWLE